MPTSHSLSFLLLVALAPPIVAVGQESYPIHPDSVAKAEVPHGKVESFTFSSSEVFPGTTRDYFVYVPDQYDASEPAALMVFQDGKGYVAEKGQWRVPTVFDNLIASGEMPVTIAVCVNPGVVEADNYEAQNRFNRSLEYDTVSDRYASFLIDELLPVVAQKYSITDDPNRRGHRRQQQRCDRGVRRRLASAGSISTRFQYRRNLRGAARWKRVSDVDSQIRTETDSRFFAGRK